MLHNTLIQSNPVLAMLRMPNNKYTPLLHAIMIDSLFVLNTAG